MNGLQVLSQWQNFMDHPTGAWLGWLNAIYWLGAALTYPVVALIAQRWGRKSGIYLGYVMLTIGTIVQASAPNDIAFMVSRLVMGIAAACFGNCAPLLINEVAYPTHRSICNALYMTGWYVGGTIGAWTVFGTRTYASSWAWRLPTICQLILPLVALPGVLMIPESPRWYISTDQREKAREMLVKHHADGDESSPLVEYELREITLAIAAEKAAHAGASYAGMLKTPGNRWRLFISVTLGLFCNWSGNGIITFYLAMVLSSVGITDITEQTMISAFLQVWNLLWAVAAAFSVDRFGRKPLFLSSAGIMLTSYVLVTGLSGAFAEQGVSTLGVAAIPFLFTFFAGYNIALLVSTLPTSSPTFLILSFP